jgi:hypothetical protein
VLFAALPDLSAGFSMENPVKNTRRKPKLEAPRPAPVRLVQIPAAVDADGEPRIALEVLPHPGSVSRRPTLLMFASMAAALASKRMLEGTR